MTNITESKAISLFSEKFGTDFMSRLDKFNEEVAELNEEVAELNEAIEIYNTLKNVRPEIIDEMLEHIDDELSDVQGTFTHLASLRSKFQKEMLDNCIDKVKGRESNPNYKRYQHESNHN